MTAPSTASLVGAKSLSDAGRAALELEEGLRLTAYQDQRGIWTIGYGHTSGGPYHILVYKGLTITKANADTIFAFDTQFAVDHILELVKVPLTQNQLDAVTSLYHNIGMEQFMHSTVLRLLNASDYDGAAVHFHDWVHPASLAARRDREVAMFLHGKYRTATGKVITMNFGMVKGLIRTGLAFGGGTALAHALGAAPAADIAASAQSSTSWGTLLVGIAGPVIAGLWSIFDKTIAQSVDHAVAVTGGASSPIAPVAAEAKATAK